MTQITSLKDRAMIVGLKVSKWSGRKFDRTATEEVNKTHQTADAGRFNKILIDPSEIRKINNAESKIRRYQYENTLPWGDNGDRLLPAAHYFKYTQGLKPLIDNFNEVTEEFVYNYERLVAERKPELNGLFRESDYPTKAEIGDLFGLKLVFQPMPDSDDFRLSIASDEEIERLREEIGVEICSRQESAIADLYKRCQDAIQRVITTLDQSEDKVFRNTLVDSIGNLVDMLPSFNFSKDARLNKLTNKMKELVIDPDSLRKDKTVRENYLNRAKQLNSMFF